MASPDSTPERWAPIAATAGRYAVSTSGRVLRAVPQFGYGPGRLLKPYPCGAYLQVSMSVDGRTIKDAVHRLVLSTFVGPCPRGHECAHRDGCGTNNRLDNLRWATSKSNHADRLRHGTHGRGERCGTAKLTEASVRDIRARCAAGEHQRAVARRLGVSHATVGDAVRRKTWAHVS